MSLDSEIYDDDGPESPFSGTSECLMSSCEFLSDDSPALLESEEIPKETTLSTRQITLPSFDSSSSSGYESLTESKEVESEVLLVDADLLVAGNDCVVLKMDDHGDNSKQLQVILTGKMMKLADGSSAFIQHSNPGSNEIYTPIKLHNGSTLYVLTSSLLDAMGKSTNEDDLTVKKEKSKGFGCPYENCSRSYSSPHHLKVHIRAHTGDRPFKCTAKGCSKTFSTAFGLKTHRRTHNNERPYSCRHHDCIKCFKTSGDLQKHIRTHTGERPFLCPVFGCGRSFTTRNICKVHVRTHTGERPYSCTYPDCVKTFASLTNQRNHLRIHSGERPYVCLIPDCGKKFTEYSSLYKHHQVHTELRFHCDCCSKRYRTLSGVTAHIKSAHGPQASIISQQPSC